MGCGIFGLGGLIVGVGLTFWLGSQALSGGGGSKPEASDRSTTTTSTTAPAVEDLPSDQPPGAALAIEAPADLGDGGTVILTGSSLTPGPLEVSICLAGGPRSGLDTCDRGRTTQVEVGPDGTFELSLTVPRVLVAGGGATDCAAGPGTCVLAAQRPDASLRPALTADLAFASDLPPLGGEQAPGG